MGRACGTHREKRKVRMGFAGKSNQRGHAQDNGCGLEDNVTIILDKDKENLGLETSCPVQRRRKDLEKTEGKKHWFAQNVGGFCPCAHTEILKRSYFVF